MHLQSHFMPFQSSIIESELSMRFHLTSSGLNLWQMPGLLMFKHRPTTNQQLASNGHDRRFLANFLSAIIPEGDAVKRLASQSRFSFFS